MKASLLRRIEALEEALARERASKIRYRLVWIDSDGTRTDAATGLPC